MLNKELMLKIKNKNQQQNKGYNNKIKGRTHFAILAKGNKNNPRRSKTQLQREKVLQTNNFVTMLSRKLLTNEIQ